MGFKNFNEPNKEDQQAPIAQEKSAADGIIEKVLKTQEQIATVNAISSALGGNKQNDNLGNVVISKALDVFEKQNEKVQQMVSDKDKDVVTARAEADKAKADLFGIVAGQINTSLERLEKIQEDYRNPKGQVKERTFVEQAKDLKDALAIFAPPQQQNTIPDRQSSDSAMTITLQQMRQDHELAMKKLDIELTRLQQDMKLKLDEFAANRQEKEREFSASQKFRGDAFNTVTDIATAAAEGFKGKVSGGIAVQPNQPKNQGQDNSEMMAAIKSFPCQSCGEQVAIPNTGNEAVCPQCDTHYELKRGSGIPIG